MSLAGNRSSCVRKLKGHSENLKLSVRKQEKLRKSSDVGKYSGLRCFGYRTG